MEIRRGKATHLPLVYPWRITSEDTGRVKAGRADLDYRIRGGRKRWSGPSDWFLGDNDLAMPLADPDDGSCRDGLGPEGVNGKMGAESTLAWLVAVERMRPLHNEASAQPTELMAGRRRRCWVRVGSSPGHPAGRPIATNR